MIWGLETPTPAVDEVSIKIQHNTWVKDQYLDLAPMLKTVCWFLALHEIRLDGRKDSIYQIIDENHGIQPNHQQNKL